MTIKADLNQTHQASLFGRTIGNKLAGLWLLNRDEANSTKIAAAAKDAWDKLSGVAESNKDRTRQFLTALCQAATEQTKTAA